MKRKTTASRTLPRAISIGGRSIRVKLVKRLSDGDYGQYDYRSIQVSEVNETDRDRWATLFHEMVHAALDIGGVSYALGDKLEEAVVRNIEQILLPAVLKIAPKDLTL